MGNVRELKWQRKERKMSRKRLPARADRAVWEKVTERRVGIKWDSIVDKVWKDKGNQEEILSMEKFGGYKTEVKERIKKRERLALRIMVKEQEDFEIYGGSREDVLIGSKRYLRRLAKTLKLRSRVGDLDLPERRKRYAGSQEAVEDVHICPSSKAIE